MKFTLIFIPGLQGGDDDEYGVDTTGAIPPLIDTMFVKTPNKGGEALPPPPPQTNGKYILHYCSFSITSTVQPTSSSEDELNTSPCYKQFIF